MTIMHSLTKCKFENIPVCTYVENPTDFSEEQYQDTKNKSLNKKFQNWEINLEFSERPSSSPSLETTCFQIQILNKKIKNK